MAEPEPEIELALPDTLPLLPLRRTVVFPTTIQPLGVNRPKSIEAVNQALAGNRMVAIVAQRDDEDDPLEANLYRVGTAGVIRQMAKGPNGLQVLVAGVSRIRIQALVTKDTWVEARIEPLPEVATASTEVDARARRLKELAERAFAATSGLSPELRQMILGIDDPIRLAYLLASFLDMKPEDRQALLEENDLSAKLAAVSTVLSREVEVLELKGKIESQAQQEMTEAQRQHYLRQQLKAIQQELGESEGQEIKELRERVEEAKLPEAVNKAATRELDRLDRMPTGSPEYQMIRTYIDWVLEIPWTTTTDDQLDPTEVRRVLDEDHYDLEKVKDRIVEYIAVRKLKGDMKGPILCFVGPPGVGKTSLGQSIARAMNRKFARISLGGVRDEAEIRGHRRTYIGSMPGRIIQAMRQVGSANPVLMLDEIDKVSAGFQGDPAAALLEVLDPAQNHTFRDHYLEVPYDLSRILFITTANQLGPIHPALLDRLEVIPLIGYSEDEKVHIAKRYLIPRQLAEHGLTAEMLHITEPAIRRTLMEYTREAGVRNLERQIGTIARKIAARIAADPEARQEPAEGAAVDSPAARFTITPDAVPEFLGPPRFLPEVDVRTSRPGVATGLAWTETGGDVLFIEASLLPGGQGKVSLTGQLGNVMQESAQAAVSHIRARADDLGVPVDFLNQHDLHVHVPSGAIPKDGPSAGVTIATAILSAVRGQPVRNDVAMTGEITLSGMVLPVGGIREKALAAKRHGIGTLILPERNLRDVEELTEDVRQAITFVPVRTLEDVLQTALPLPAAAEPQPHGGPWTDV